MTLWNGLELPESYFHDDDVYLIHGDCCAVLEHLPQAVDLVVTSPPYDNLRNYGGYTFDFHGIAHGLKATIVDNGVLVWIVGDAVVNGSESGSSFRQALFFMEIGFRLHDTMIWHKQTFTAVGALVTRYAPVFDYMFVLSKGKPKTFNPIKDRRNKHAGTLAHGTIRQPNGDTKRITTHNQKVIPEFGQRFNVWEIGNVGRRGVDHPATFPYALARDHIISWSEEGDTVLDPFFGYGTSAMAAVALGRKFIGIEIDEGYCEMAAIRYLKGLAGMRAQQ